MNQKNVSTFLSFAFLIVIVCSALLPVFSLQNNVSISSHGTVNYPELPPPPLPTPNPSPYIGTNLAPLSTWTGAPQWAPCYWDTAELSPNGNPSWRNEGVIPYKNREMNSDWIAVTPGDRIVFRAWIKVDPSNLGTTSETCPQSGARIGIDFYDNTGRIEGLHYNPAGGLPVQPEPTQGIIDNFVPWGSDWTYREIDLIVPEIFWYGKTPTGVILWLGVMTNRMYGTDWQGELAPAWLSETEFYINPT